MSLTVALSKGKLLPGSEALFRRAGLPFPDGEGRKLVVEAGFLRFLFVKDMDVPTYVEYGVADCGVAGRDVLLETGADVLEPLDLGFGRCRLAVASPAGSGFAPDRSATIRVASKYARVAAAHFLGRGLAVEVVKLAGSVEIAPGLGLADCIVDVVETGRTLAEDAQRVEELRDDPKNRSENVMIVDLLRNDISRSCHPGTVRVTGLCEVERFETVLHLVSTVVGMLRDDPLQQTLAPFAHQRRDPVLQGPQILLEQGQFFPITGFQDRDDSGIHSMLSFVVHPQNTRSLPRGEQFSYLQT